MPAWTESGVDGEIYLAGQYVPAGKYRQMDSRREVYVDAEDTLPASLDGRVACYERLASTWAEHQQREHHSAQQALPVIHSKALGAQRHAQRQQRL